MSQTHGPHSDIYIPKKYQLHNLSTQKITMFLVYQKNPTPAVNCAHVIVDLS